MNAPQWLTVHESLQPFDITVYSESFHGKPNLLADFLKLIDPITTARESLCPGSLLVLQVTDTIRI